MTSYLNTANLPASLDISPLVRKVEHVEKQLQQRCNDDPTTTTINNDGTNALERVKLIELDPYYHHPPSPQQRQQLQSGVNDGSSNGSSSSQKIRLFLAVAYGSTVVAVQLFALELVQQREHTNDDSDDDDGNDGNDEIEKPDNNINNKKTSSFDNIDDEDEEEGMEWVDVSAYRVRSSITNHHDHHHQNHGGKEWHREYNDNKHEKNDEMEDDNSTTATRMNTEKNVESSHQYYYDEVGVDPIVRIVFPPSLVTRKKYISQEYTSTLNNTNNEEDDDDDDKCFTVADITSCALIPAPSIIIQHNRYTTSSSTTTATTNPTSSSSNQQCHSSSSSSITQRTVAIMLGNIHDYVYSILLNVSLVEAEVLPDTNNNSSNNNSSNNDHIHFDLKYEECKVIKDGKLMISSALPQSNDDKKTKKEEEEEGLLYTSSFPHVQQILPHARMVNGYKVWKPVTTTTTTTNNTNNNYQDANDKNYEIDPNSYIQIFHPSLSSSSSGMNNSSNPISMRDAENNEQQQQQQYQQQSQQPSGIKSISFCHYSRRRKKKQSSSSTFHYVGDDDELLPPTCNNGQEEEEEMTKQSTMIISQDIIWITYNNGTIIKLPSWRPFITFQNATTTSTTTSTGRSNDIATAHNMDDNITNSHCNSDSSTMTMSLSVVIPLINNYPSPLDVPSPLLINQRMHDCTAAATAASSMEDENKIESSDIHYSENDYWNLFAMAICYSDDVLHSSDGGGVRQGQQQRLNNHPSSVKMLILAEPSASALTPAIIFNSSRAKVDTSIPLTPPRANDDDDDISVHGMHIKEEEEEKSHINNEILSNRELDMSSNGDDDDDEGYVIGGGTTALVKGALGMALGAVRWGFGTGGGSIKDDGVGVNVKSAKYNNIDAYMDINDDSGFSVTKHDIRRNKRVEAIDMCPWPLSSASYTFSDGPRKYETAVVDPSGTYVATTDNLGRVTLFDLETNQPIRMIKGMRNVCCYFTELPYYSKGHGVKSRSYLVIHLRQRGSIEVFRLPQGPKVISIAVPQQKDFTVIDCYGPPSEGGRVSSFLLERNRSDDKNSPEECLYILDKLIINDPDVVVVQKKAEKQIKAISLNESKMYLNIFMQLLAPDTNLQFNAQTVLATFKSIRSLVDLGEALDVLSKSIRLEREMGIDTSCLHSQAISHCKVRLRQAHELEEQEGSGSVRKEAILYLSSKLAYHDRLVHAYDVLHRYETRTGLESDEQREPISAHTPWATEALSWLATASGNDAMKGRFLPTFGDVLNDGSTDKPLEFTMFADACATCQTNNNVNDDCGVYLTKVKRDRLPILKRVFRPLLQDLFVYKVVNSLFINLNLTTDYDVQQQYFGEWVSSLSTEVIAQTNMSGTFRPMIRWLQDLILGGVNAATGSSHQSGNHHVDIMVKKIVTLDSLMKFCMNMEDLPKAFLLSVICMDAVSSASVQLEHKTYGKVTTFEAMKPWEDLLRKLRLCLLVTLRLSGNINPVGEYSPMTVSSVSRADSFSVYSWIAVDELTLSHDNQVILALESACLSSSETFYPSTSEGDSDKNKNTIFQSCSQKSRSPTNPMGLTSDTTNCRSLLFYLKDYAHFTTQLAANRALILAQLWSKSPQDLPLLRNTISTLYTVVERFDGRFSLATCIEIYQSILRPVCRAMILGFIDQELDETIYSPLIDNDEFWLNEFISTVKQTLSMIIDCMVRLPHTISSTTKASTTNNISESDENNSCPEMLVWPPIVECKVLTDILKKYPTVHQTSLELHHLVIFAFQMTRNVQSLSTIVPSFTKLFLVGSLFIEMKPIMSQGSFGEQKQKDLLDKAIIDHAAKSSSPILDNFSCIHSIELFGRSLGLDVAYVRTRYLIEMIRLGKDASINDLLGGGVIVSSLFDKSFFAEEVIHILCKRLHATIHSLKQMKRYRGIHSLLDADACQWLRNEVSASEVATKTMMSSKNNVIATSSLITTHSLIMRLQSMLPLEESLRNKIDTLFLMSGTLLKVVQTQDEQETNTLT